MCSVAHSAKTMLGMVTVYCAVHKWVNNEWTLRKERKDHNTKSMWDHGSAAFVNFATLVKKEN